MLPPKKKHEWVAPPGTHSTQAQLNECCTARPASLINLRCKVELHKAIFAPLQVILNQQGSIRNKPQFHCTTEGSCLREVHQVTQGERRCHWLVHCQSYSVLGLLRLPRLQHDVATSCVALDTEGYAFLAGLHLHGLAKLLQITANLLELR